MTTLEFEASWSTFFRGGSGGGISGSSLSLCKLPHELKKVSGGEETGLQSQCSYRTKHSATMFAKWVILTQLFVCASIFPTEILSTRGHHEHVFVTLASTIATGM